MADETRLILLASEQVIPNVVSALHYWRSGGLAAIHILYTDDDRRSRGPAARLKMLFEELRAVAPFDNRTPAVVSLDDGPVSIEPQAVRARIAHIVATAPTARWVVNVTGGLKLMAFGGIGLPEPRPQIVYLERGQGWFVLETDAQGTVSARRDAALPDNGASLLDSVPIASVIRTQFIDGNRFFFSDKGKPAEMDVAKFVRNGVDKRWDWSQLSEPGEQAGFAFERLIGAAVLRMGIDNVVWSLKIGNAHEMDLVLCHRGIVWLLDLKLMPREGRERPHAQMREAAASGSGIGGVDRRVIMLRPNWEADEEIAALAKAHNVEVVGQEQAGHLFSVLAERLGGGLDDNLREAERLLCEGKARLGFALATTSAAQRLLANQRDSSVIDTDDLFGAVCRAANQNWMLIRDRGQLRLWTRTGGESPTGSRLEWPELVQNENLLFRQARLEKSTSGKTLYVTWRDGTLTPEQRDKITATLDRARGRHLNTGSLRTWYKES